MDGIKRDLSVQFYHKSFQGLTHENVVDELKKMNIVDEINAIQITEKNCVVSCKNIEAKNKLLINNIELNGRTVKLFDVEKTITNVTVKDAPFELKDEVIIAYMAKFGQVIPGSIRRGKIQGTDIENGTRYLSVVGCVPTIPIRNSIGRFDIRIFADNNRTECIHCGQKSHPSYRCPNKPVRTKECFICKNSNHIARDCPQKEEKLCYICKKNDHVQRNCPTRLYGEYANDVLEGTNISDVESDLESVHEVLNTNVEDTSTLVKPPDVSVILGASNVKRISIPDKNVIDASISGASLDKVDSVISRALSLIPEHAEVKNVTLCLGTNDITRNIDDPEQVTCNLSTAINKVQESFPETAIGVCGIIPRKGKSEKIKIINETAQSVNKFAKKMCERFGSLTYVDTPIAFQRQGQTVRELFDPNDSSGVHVNESGATEMWSVMENFIRNATFTQDPGVAFTPTSYRKRTNSDRSATPRSAERQANKMSKF
ncbi:uncharacterized protein LOC132561603 [Ylistrum balloti]|uniref:uncharacterized protein LOC132549912 n=1 Tax=Ylistrum balloti TaxID=509963 RepID=UPI0029059448|nr:uncharacterized protein LOC132549912 [Ylistrum balloti]XP_060082285.1 uncharacterized protein LOC132561603 [Ylistrum balloti]